MWQINEIASRRLEGAGTRGVGPPAAARVVGVRVMGAPLVSLCVATMVFAYSGGAVAQKGTTFAETAPRTESGVQLGALPSFEAVRTAHRPSQRLILDRYGEPLAALRTDFNERRDAWVSLEAMAPIMQRAVLLSEDRRFHEHGGVDWAALASAGFGWLTGEGLRGASTISMQLVAMLDSGLQRPAGGRSLAQKLAQARQAWRLEARWSKVQILEAYLNLAAFRGELRGIGAVSRVMFGKHPHGLDAREAAVAAALLRGPNAAPAHVAQRACALLIDMAWGEGCDALEHDVRRWLASTARPAADAPSLAPHFARLVAAQVPADTPGDTLHTTLDARLQRLVMQSVARHVAGMGHAQLTDAAVVVLDNRSAEVLAYVGSSGSASMAAQVDHARARRQAGSTLKPFLYALALELRFLTAASLLEDTALDVATAGGLYVPQNYDRTHAGLVSVRTALAASLNVPAVRTLMLVGPERFADRLRSLGLPLRHDADHYGYSLALGSADVDLLSLTNAYRVLADEGRWQVPQLRLHPTPHPHRRPTSHPHSRRIDPLASWVVGDILSDRRARALTFGLESPLSTRFWSAVKTGTSKDMRDNWALGWSDRYTVGVWVGNSAGLSMRDVSGVSGAGPIWHEVMSALHAHEPSIQPLPPEALRRGRVHFAGGLEASRDEYFLPGTEVTHVEPAAPAAARARIASPPQGTIIALDPDLPAANQRLALRAHVPGEAREPPLWRIGPTVIAHGAQAYWRPVPGRHRIVLQDPDGAVLDEITVQVRDLPLTRRR